MNHRKILLLLCAALLLCLPWLGYSIVTAIASRIIVFAVLAVSLDIIVGYGGLISFGQAAFFGIGAYAVGASVHYGYTNGYVHFALAIGAAALFAAFVAALVVRTRGIYFIMLTLAFAQMVFYLAVGQAQFGGDDGMPLDTRSDFGSMLDLASPMQFYYFALAILVLAVVVARRLVGSRFGLILAASRQNEERLEALGYSVYWYRLAAFVIAAGMSGLAGALVANLNAYVSPNFLDWQISGMVIMILVIGGVGTIYGAVAGAAVYLVLQEIVSNYTSHWAAVFGPLLVVAALFWHGGLYGVLHGVLFSRVKKT